METAPTPYRVFLVEDHPAMRAAYADLIALEPGLDLCGEAETAEDALVALDSAPCDLVVTDVRLPGMDGIALTERLRHAYPGLPVLVVSGHQDDVYVRRALDAGAVAFLPKRDLSRTLAGAVRDALGAPRLSEAGAPGAGAVGLAA